MHISRWVFARRILPKLRIVAAIGAGALSTPVMAQSAEPGQQVVLAEQVYEPGTYDSGPVHLAASSGSLKQLVCVLSVGSAVEVSGVAQYSTDGGVTWQEWAPFRMSLGETTWDAKRQEWVTPSDTCSGSTATDASTWTDVRVQITLVDAPAMLSASVVPAPPDADATD
jgi:hypothetical protein